MTAETAPGPESLGAAVAEEVTLALRERILDELETIRHRRDVLRLELGDVLDLVADVVGNVELTRHEVGDIVHEAIEGEELEARVG